MWAAISAILALASKAFSWLTQKSVTDVAHDEGQAQGRAEQQSVDQAQELVRANQTIKAETAIANSEATGPSDIDGAIERAKGGLI